MKYETINRCHTVKGSLCLYSLGHIHYINEHFLDVLITFQKSTTSVSYKFNMKHYKIYFLNVQYISVTLYCRMDFCLTACMIIFDASNCRCALSMLTVFGYFFTMSNHSFGKNISYSLCCISEIISIVILMKLYVQQNTSKS